MIKKFVSKFAGLTLALAVILTACAWMPFKAPNTIHTTPEGAEVYEMDSDTLLGVTPYATGVFFTEKLLEVRKENFFSEPVLLDFNSEEHVNVTLDPEPILVYSIPTADLYEAGSDTPLMITHNEVDIFIEDRNYTLKAEGFYDKELTLGFNSDRPTIIEMDRRPIITLTITQADVEIYEDGLFVCNAPMTEEILEPRTFELKKKGYFTKTVELTSNSAYDITEELVPLPIVEIQTVPSGAAVYLIGKKASIGKAPLKLTIEEKTSFEVRKDRYYPETFTVEAKSQLAKVSLKAMPYITIKSNPSGAQVYLNSNLVGTTPLEQLVEKSTSYTLKKNGYLPKNLSLNSKSPTSSTVTLEKEPIVVEEPKVEEKPVAVAAPVVTATPETVEEEVAEKKMPIALISGVAILVIAGIAFAMKKKS
jgi:hypothetical protein